MLEVGGRGAEQAEVDNRKVAVEARSPMREVGGQSTERGRDSEGCLLYTSDAADDTPCVDL
eukprot:6414533-Pyramimonas_sp.AAC.1